MVTNTERWVDGSASEFLGLSPEESAYVDLKLRLSKALRRYRRLRPLSQGAFAKLIKSSQSRVAKMENGDPSVSIDLLLRALIRLGVTRQEIANLLVFDEPKPWSLKASNAITVQASSTQRGVYGPPLFYGDAEGVKAEVKKALPSVPGQVPGQFGNVRLVVAPA